MLGLAALMFKTCMNAYPMNTHPESFAAAPAHICGGSAEAMGATPVIERQETVKTSLNAILSAALLVALATPALAQNEAQHAGQNSYPRLVGSADDYRVEYGPGPLNNILGGGGVRITVEEEGRLAVSHDGAGFAQIRKDGRVPVLLGGEDDRTVTWVAPSRPKG